MSGTVVPVSPRAATAALAEWYASHSTIRRLWALEEIEMIRVVVTLEPTPDGDDTQPAWLAYSRLWAQELRLGLQRTVRLQLITEPPSHIESSCEWHSALITELSWRDPSRAAD
jgi:hypothetical protein